MNYFGHEILTVNVIYDHISSVYHSGLLLFVFFFFLLSTWESLVPLRFTCCWLPIGFLPVKRAIAGKNTTRDVIAPDIPQADSLSGRNKRSQVASQKKRMVICHC